MVASAILYQKMRLIQKRQFVVNGKDYVSDYTVLKILESLSEHKKSEKINQAHSLALVA